MFIISADALAQDWVQTNGPVGDTIYEMIISPSGNIIVATGSHIYRSDTSGLNWKDVADFPCKNTLFIYDSIGHYFLLANETSIYNSTDDGMTWTLIYQDSSLQRITSIIDRGDIWIGTVGNVYRSLDKGYTWELAYNPSNLAFGPDGSEYLGNFDYMITDIYGNGFGFSNSEKKPAMYRSKHNLTWSLFNEGLSCTKAYSMIRTNNGILIVATDSGIFTLEPGGCKWKNFSDGLTTLSILSLATDRKGHLYAGSDGIGIFKSTKSFDIPLKLTGLLSMDSTLDFDTVSVSATSCKDILIRNTGLAPLTLQSITTLDPFPFFAADESVNKLPLTLKPNDWAMISICFRPHQPAHYASSIIWNTDIDPSLCIGTSNVTKLSGFATESQSVDTKLHNHNFSIQPNPIHSKAEINFSTASSNHVKIECFDMLGRSRMILTDMNCGAGENSFVWDTTTLPDGAYFVQYTNGMAHSSQSVIVVH
jgi:hypothetical protein